jgi:AGZA family xanthine/uracil permease-like MFS transporter
MNTTKRQSWFVKGDLDGFFGLAVDNLVQVLVIVALCRSLCGFDDGLVYSRILPGIAVSLLLGNLFYALHARWVARRDDNPSCTALPYGINTPSVFAFILFILAPVYRITGDATLTWQVGLIACIGSGIIEFAAAFIGGWVRRVTPRAALLSALAAIGVIFIASPFAFQIFERPLVAILPMFIVLIGYFARVRFPLGLPSGLVALVLGTILAWTVPFLLGPTMMSIDAVRAAADQVGLHLPQHTWFQVLDAFKAHPELIWAYLGVIVPMGLINAVGSLQNIESAEAAGDRFSTGPCMAVNGIGSIAAGLFGSCFPTTIYIGHPGWKALGARSGYSIINGLFFTAVFILGLGAILVSVIPMEAGIAIVMWIGIIITAQSYEAVPRRHYAAVAISFFPAVAMMAVLLVPQMLHGLGDTSGVLPMIQAHGYHLETIRTDDWWPVGVYALSGANSGFIITCIIISAISAFLIDRKFKAAGTWCVIAMVMTLLGFQHAFRIEPGQPAPQELLLWQRPEASFEKMGLHFDTPEGTFFHRGYRLAATYGIAALLLFGIHALRQRGKGFGDVDPDTGDLHYPPAEHPAPPREVPSFAMPPRPSEAVARDQRAPASNEDALTPPASGDVMISDEPTRPAASEEDSEA